MYEFLSDFFTFLSLHHTLWSGSVPRTFLKWLHRTSPRTTLLLNTMGTSQALPLLSLMVWNTSYLKHTLSLPAIMPLFFLLLWLLLFSFCVHSLLFTYWLFLRVLCQMLFWTLYTVLFQPLWLQLSTVDASQGRWLGSDFSLRFSLVHPAVDWCLTLSLLSSVGLNPSQMALLTSTLFRQNVLANPYVLPMSVISITMCWLSWNTWCYSHLFSLSFPDQMHVSHDTVTSIYFSVNLAKLQCALSCEEDNFIYFMGLLCKWN